MKHMNLFTKNIFLSFLIAIISVSNVLTQNKCRILALSGGGDKGAYQAGAIVGLINNLPAEEVKWDVVTGISIGSINALAVGVHEVGKESELTSKLLDEWRGIDGKHSIYKDWLFGGILRGLLYESGIFNTEPGYNFVRNVLKDYSGLKRDTIIGVTNLRTGAYQTYSNKDLLTIDDLTNAGMCSSAVPLFFPYCNFKGETYIDGGVRYGTDIFSGVHRCEDKGFDHKDIILDVVLCSGNVLEEVDPKNLTSIPILLRYFDISNYSKTMDDIEDAEHYLNKITIRYVVSPSKALPSSIFPLQFNPQQIEEMIQLGQIDAKNKIGLGVGGSYNQMKEIRRQEKAKRFYR